MDIFEEKKIVPMAPTLSQPFDSEDYIFEIKFDGMRCINYSDKNKTVFRSRINKDITHRYPELKDAYKQMKNKCILDSEIVILNNGKPDYALLNERRFLENNARIEQTSKRIPATLIIYDILYLVDKPVMNLPLLERKELLEKNISETQNIILSRYVSGSGIQFFENVVKQELEGTVSKLKEGRYVQGRSKLWLKSKRKADIDLLLCGHLEGKGFLFCNEKFEYVISIHSVDKSTKEYLLNYIDEHKVEESPLRVVPHSLFNSIWVKPKLMCVIEYMTMTSNGSLREAVYKGIKL